MAMLLSSVLEELEDVKQTHVPLSGASPAPVTRIRTAPMETDVS